MEGNAIVLDANKHFGKQLREERIEMGLTQTQVAESMGVDSSSLCHFEKGDKTRGNGHLTTAIDYARALGADDLIFELWTE